MNKRVITVASFTTKDKLTSFLTYLKNKFNVSDTFLFGDINDETQVIVTFKLTLEDGERLDMKTHLPNSVLVHKKGMAIYTINALNMLIEYDSNAEIGNIVYETYKIDWNKYQGKLIITKNNELIFIDIKRIFL